MNNSIAVYEKYDTSERNIYKSQWDNNRMNGKDEFFWNGDTDFKENDIDDKKEDLWKFL